MRIFFKYPLAIGTGALALSLAVAAGAQPAQPAQALDACVAPAATMHQVNPQILRAILTVESSDRPNIVTVNSNGSIDVGIAGINSIHFAELAKYGIAPHDLLQPCVAIYVAAWHLRKQITRFGNTWFGIGSYHSTTPSRNLVYQHRIFNELQRVGAIATAGATSNQLAQGHLR